MREVDKLDKLAKVLITTGAVIAIIACMALDSNGVYGYYAGAVAIAGGAIAGAGYGLHILAKKHRKCEIESCRFRQRVRDEEDIIWIEEV